MVPPRIDGLELHDTARIGELGPAQESEFVGRAATTARTTARRGTADCPGARRSRPGRRRQVTEARSCASAGAVTGRALGREPRIGAAWIAMPNVNRRAFDRSASCRVGHREVQRERRSRLAFGDIGPDVVQVDVIGPFGDLRRKRAGCRSPQSGRQACHRGGGGLRGRRLQLRRLGFRRRRRSRDPRGGQGHSDTTEGGDHASAGHQQLIVGQGFVHFRFLWIGGIDSDRRGVSRGCGGRS